MPKDEDHVKVPSGRLHRFMLSPSSECCELSGPHFDFDRTFIRPEGMAALGQIAETMRGKTGKKGAIFGHTDTVGDETYNKKLSEQRARVVLAAMTHDPAPWEERYQAEHWGTRSVQVMLNAVQPPQLPRVARRRGLFRRRREGEEGAGGVALQDRASLS